MFPKSASPDIPYLQLFYLTHTHTLHPHFQYLHFWTHVCFPKSNLGTGLWDRTETTEDSATQVKVTKHHQVLRFTIRAVNGQEQNGNVILSEVSDQIDTLLSDLCREGSADLIDTETEESLHIEQTIFQSRSDLAPLEKRIPFVYQQSLSYLFVEHRFKTRVVENRMDRVKIEI